MEQGGGGDYWLYLYQLQLPVQVRRPARLVVLVATRPRQHESSKPVRDWSLITGRGELQNGKIAGQKLFVPLPSPPPPPLFFFLKSGHFLRPPPPPFNVAKTSRYCIKTTPKLVVPPPPFSTHGLNFFRPPPLFFVGVKLHMPLPFCSPPPPSP